MRLEVVEEARWTAAIPLCACGLGRNHQGRAEALDSAKTEIPSMRPPTGAGKRAAEVFLDRSPHGAAETAAPTCSSGCVIDVQARVVLGFLGRSDLSWGAQGNLMVVV